MYVPDAEQPRELAPQELQEDGAQDRVSYRELVVALARRNQNSVRLQLELVAQLKIEPATAGGVSAQFERLAGKLRRNNDNLVALSRGEAEAPADPVTTGEVLLAAVSEIEPQHRRVNLQPPPSARIAGHAAGDLTRLLAELLDNAAAFSGPEALVSLETGVTEGGGLLIDVEDRGIGMTDAQIAQANARLAGRSPLDATPSSPVGLLVAGHLAGRHGLDVAVHHGRDGVGVRVAVTIPGKLVTDLRETVPIPLLPPAAASPTTRPTVPAVPAVSPAVPAVPASVPPPLPSVSQPVVPVPVPVPEETAWPAEIAADTDVLADWPSDPDASARWPESPASPAKSEPDAKTPGSDLFAAVTTDEPDEWWHREPPSDVASESTPIFDAMVSAWFSSSPASEPSSGAAQPAMAGSATSNWNSAADAGFRMVEAASRSAPATFTEAGLPRRRRGEQLMPGAIAPITGTASPAPAAEETRPARDAVGVRGRLSNFQRGLKLGRRGKHRSGQDDAADGTQG